MQMLLNGISHLKRIRESFPMKIRRSSRLGRNVIEITSRLLNISHPRASSFIHSLQKREKLKIFD